MIGQQIRKAREAAGVPGTTFARLAGLARSRLQMLEDGGNVRLQTLEKAIAQLPNLLTITLGGVEFVAIDRVRATVDSAATGATRLQQPPAVDAATRQRLARLESLVDAGALDDES